MPVRSLLLLFLVLLLRLSSSVNIHPTDHYHRLGLSLDPNVKSAFLPMAPVVQRLVMMAVEREFPSAISSEVVAAHLVDYSLPDSSSLEVAAPYPD